MGHAETECQHYVALSPFFGKYASADLMGA